MKFLLLLVVVLVVIWLLRGGRRRAQPPPAAPPPPAPEAPSREAIVACTHCGLMLPVGETLPATRGKGSGVFCTEAHRAAFEKTAPPP